MLASLFEKRQPVVGARPGTLVIGKEAPPPRIHVIRFNAEEVYDSDIDDPEQLRTAVEEDKITWIDVQGFGDRSTMRRIADLFEFHPLLIEDVVNAPQRPKTERYGDQLLVIVRMARMGEGSHIDIEQVSIIKGPNYVITFQERYGDVLDPVRKRIRNKNLIRTHQADYLTYAIMDTIVDGYYPVLEKIGDRLESLEDEVIANPTPELLGRLHRMKNRLVNLRRCIWPQREAVNALVRGDHAGITDEVRLFFRDTYDHCVQTSEVTEMYREMVTGLMNTYLSSVANRTNDVMKVLTIVATIFIPLTFLAGIYGMNFEHMPELQMSWAYPLIWLTMLLVAGGMLVFFWRKGWIQLGSSRPGRTARKAAGAQTAAQHAEPTESRR